jgi:hypothetical protein
MECGGLPPLLRSSPIAKLSSLSRRLPQARSQCLGLGFLFSVVAQGESASPAAFLLGFSANSVAQSLLTVLLGSSAGAPGSIFYLGLGVPLPVAQSLLTVLLGSSAGAPGSIFYLGLGVPPPPGNAILPNGVFPPSHSCTLALLHSSTSSLRTSAPSAPLRYLYALRFLISDR